jgi:hypothetical protein
MPLELKGERHLGTLAISPTIIYIHVYILSPWIPTLPLKVQVFCIFPIIIH